MLFGADMVNREPSDSWVAMWNTPARSTALRWSPGLPIFLRWLRSAIRLCSLSKEAAVPAGHPCYEQVSWARRFLAATYAPRPAARQSPRAVACFWDLTSQYVSLFCPQLHVHHFLWWF